MSPELQEQLFLTYPQLFANRTDRRFAIHWGITCGDGWYRLIECLCARVQKLVDDERMAPHRIAQVKEQYGALTIYWNLDADLRVFELKHYAHDLSLYTCEVCGAPRTCEEKNAWWRTRCDAHRDTQNVHQDGRYSRTPDKAPGRAVTTAETELPIGARVVRMTWLFLDCEWADALASELVSLALVPDDPALPEFYAERHILPSHPTPFVASVVYPLLNRGRAAMSDLAIANALRRYLASFGDPIIMHDTGIDLMLLGEALSHPEATAPLPRLRPNLIGVPGYIQRIERIFSSNTALRLQRHHALIDARVARDAFLACVG